MAVPIQERGYAYMLVNATPQAFPTPTVGSSTAAADRIKPTHAYISVEGGDIRYRCISGETPNELMGNLVRNGGVIDWTDPNGDYQQMINNFRAVAVNGAKQVALNISWRE